MTASITAQAYVPTHRDLRVEFAPGDFQSSLKTLKVNTLCFRNRSRLEHFIQSWKAGDVITPLVGLTKAAKAYSSVQCGAGPNDHVELNSDLVYSE